MHAFGVVLSPDGGVLYVGTLDPALVAIDVATGRVLTSVPLSPLLRILPVGPDDDTWWTAMWDDLEISPDGRTLAVAERDDVLLLDAATLTQRTVLRGHADLVRSLQFSHDGTKLASGSQDGTVVVWDVATGADVHRLVGHAGTVTGIAFSPDDHTAYTGGRDKRVLVWDLSGGQQLVAGVVPGGPRTTVAKQALPSPDGHAVVYSGSTVAVRDQLRFLDVASGRLGDAAPDAGGSEVSAWLPPDFHRVVTAAGPAVRLWDRGSGAAVAERAVADGDVTAVAATPDGAAILIGDRGGVLRRVDARTLEPTGAAVSLGHPILAVAGANRGPSRCSTTAPTRWPISRTATSWAPGARA